MVQRADTFDLAPLRLSAGEARRIDADVAIEPFEFGGQRYEPVPRRVPVRLDATRMVGSGWSLRLRFSAALEGPCMRCLQPAAPEIAVDAREVDQPGEGDELDSPYATDEVVDLHAWARDALVLAMPAQILCRADCAGLCAVCGEDLNEAGDEHVHERAPDPRWDKLRELKLELE